MAIATPLLAWNALRNGGFDPLGTSAYRRFLASASWHGEAGMILPDDYIKAVAAAVHEVGGLFVLDCLAEEFVEDRFIQVGGNVPDEPPLLAQ